MVDGPTILPDQLGWVVFSLQEEDDMTDKEVGELWRIAKSHNFEHRWGDMANLIRKLVEERSSRRNGLRSKNIQRALKEFGIKPKEWGPCK